MVKIKSILMVLLPSYLFGQKNLPDSTYSSTRLKWIQPMSEYITLKLTQSSDVEILGLEDDSSKILLYPNTKSSTRLAFSYKFISFSIKYSAKFLPGNDDDDIRGKTKSGGFGFGFTFRHWQQAFSFTRTKGYYLENTRDYEPDWTSGQPFIQFPDLVYTNYEGTTAYNFNPNFSVNAIATQSERQLKSAGSFMPQAFYRYYITDDRSTITANHVTQKAKNFEFVLGAGYYYNFVVKSSFYIALGLSTAAGIVFTKFETRSIDETIITKENNGIFHIDGRAGLGYNGPRFFSGAYLRISGSANEQGVSTVTTINDRSLFQVFVGYRLTAPKWLQENVKSISEKAGL